MDRNYLKELVEEFGHLITRISPDFDWADMLTGTSPWGFAMMFHSADTLQMYVDLLSVDHISFLGTIAQHAQDELDNPDVDS